MAAVEKKIGAFDIFEDRAQSLLVRWRKFHDNQALQGNNVEVACIKGFLAEINDDYIKRLCEVEEVK